MARARSVWGWGWADRLPEREVRQGMGAQLAAMLGAPGPPEVRDPSPPRLPDPRVRCALPFASAEPGDRALHARGKGFEDLVLGFGGDFSTAPDAVPGPAPRPRWSRRSPGPASTASPWCPSAAAPRWWAG
ncbi:MAG: hypothetical protein R3F59_37470 [Myxococcota bacterium]